MMLLEVFSNLFPTELIVDKNKMNKTGWGCTVCGKTLKQIKGDVHYCKNCKLKFRSIKT